jgi:diguanylate cyclase (GGDEF)-like protein
LRTAAERGRTVEAVISCPPPGSALDGLVINARDITERARLQAQLEAAAMHDPLTGLANRRHLLRDLTAATAAARPVAVVFVDLADFKAINDTLGHAAGDALLQTVAKRLSGAVRAGDLVGRLGGDEFVLLLYDLAPERAMQRAEEIGAVLREPSWIADHLVALSASVGIAISSDQRVSADELLQRADLDLYRAKARSSRSSVLLEGVRANSAG